MLALLSGFPWKLAAIAGAVVAMLLTAKACTDQREQIGALKVENAQLKSDLKASQEVAAKVSAGAKKKADIGHKADQRRRKVLDALPEDDGPVAPVLRGVLDGLRPDPRSKPEGDGSS